MENTNEGTKTCPYCGSEMKSVAKKCKTCGKWVSKQCPQCGEWVNAEAKKCRYCGYWFDSWQRRLEEKEKNAKVEASNSEDDLRAIIEDEREVDEARTLLYVETIILLALMYMSYDMPFWQFVIIGIVLFSLIQIRILRILYCLSVSVIWGLLAMIIGVYASIDNELELEYRLLTDNYDDFWWIAIVGFIVSLIFHGRAMGSRFSL